MNDKEFNQLVQNTSEKVAAVGRAHEAISQEVRDAIWEEVNQALEEIFEYMFTSASITADDNMDTITEKVFKTLEYFDDLGEIGLPDIDERFLEHLENKIQDLMSEQGITFKDLFDETFKNLPIA